MKKSVSIQARDYLERVSDNPKDKYAAEQLMALGERESDLDCFLAGALAYEKMGKGYEIAKRIIPVVKKIQSTDPKSIDNKRYQSVEIFLRKNYSPKPKDLAKELESKYGLELKTGLGWKVARLFDRKEGLEKKTFIATSILGFIGAFLFLVPNLTGNAIGNIEGSSSNLLGLVCLIIGFASIWVLNIKD